MPQPEDRWASADLKITRADLAQLPLTMLHPARNWTKADVLLGEISGQHGPTQFILKDLRGRSLLYRLLGGRSFLRREWKALHVLDGVAGVPRVLAQPDSDSLVVEHIDGMAVSAMPDGALTEKSFQSFLALVEKIHECGVTHGDLHQDNILVRADGEVALIDFATALSFGRPPRGFMRWAFGQWQVLDKRSVYKMKVFHASHLLTREEYEFLKRGGSGLYAFIKAIRRTFDRATGKKRLGKLEQAMSDVALKWNTGDKIIK